MESRWDFLYHTWFPSYIFLPCQIFIPPLITSRGIITLSYCQMHNDCCLCLTQSLHYWYPIQHCKVLRATLGMCYIKPNYSKSYLIQRDWWWGRGEGDLKLSLVTYFQQVKIPGHLGPNSVALKSQIDPLILVWGAGRWSTLLTTRGSGIRSYKAEPETVGFHEADGSVRAHFWIPLTNVLQWKQESRNMLHIWLKIKVLLNL